MCGIAGVFCLDPGCDGAAHEPLVRRMCDVQACRGPDDAGRDRASAAACLGSRRLAIIDLSPAGHQPMRTDDGPLWITYNGEVYNFPELRARAGGARPPVPLPHRHRGRPPRLRGVGRALRHRLQRHVRLRHLGPAERHAAPRPRPLRHQAALLRADAGGSRCSPPRSRRCAPAMGSVELDHRRLVEWFLYRNVDAFDTGTLHAGVSQVLPGHGRGAEGERLRPTGCTTWSSRWRRASMAASRRRVPRRWSRRSSRPWSTAVRLRLISDVPVGVLLSGGLDSSLVTAIAARETKHLTTFNVSVAGYPKLDERRYAAELCEHLGSPPGVVRPHRGELPAAPGADRLARGSAAHPPQFGGVLPDQPGGAERGHHRAPLRRGRGRAVRRLPLQLPAQVVSRPADAAAGADPRRVWNLAALFLFARLGMPVTSHGFREVLPPTVDLIDGYRRAGWLATCEDAYGFVSWRADRGVWPPCWPT